MAVDNTEPAAQQAHRAHLGSTGIGLACAAVSCFGVQPYFKTGILIGILTVLASKLVHGKHAVHMKVVQRGLLAWSSMIIIFRLMTCQPAPNFMQGFPDHW